MFRENFATDLSLDEEVRVKFWEVVLIWTRCLRIPDLDWISPGRDLAVCECSRCFSDVALCVMQH